MDIFEHGQLAVPLVDLQVNFKRVLEYGDSVRIETTLIDTPAAKLIFEYQVISVKHGFVACTGRSTQVFMAPVTKELYITVPPFIESWKKKWGLSS
jgi:acyl-CoA thioester hydrolase